MKYGSKLSCDWCEPLHFNTICISLTIEPFHKWLRAFTKFLQRFQTLYEVVLPSWARCQHDNSQCIYYLRIRKTEVHELTLVS